MTPTSPLLSDCGQSAGEIAEPFPGYPVGLDAIGPDDLGDWWLDLGQIDLPIGPPVAERAVPFSIVADVATRWRNPLARKRSRPDPTAANDDLDRPGKQRKLGREVSARPSYLP